MTTAIDFNIRTKQNILDFLNSALVVDEEATYPKRSQRISTVTTPGRSNNIDTNPEENLDDFSRNSHELLSQKIIEAFAENGIVCGVFRPEDGSGWTKRVVKAASKADIVILDWNLKVVDSETGITETADNAGTHAVNIIKELAKSDLKSGRIRLIAIYTAETKPDTELLENIEKGIKDIVTASRTDLPRTNDNIMSVGPMTVAILRKHGHTDLDKSSESELPDRLLDILARQHNGLLMNAAIAAVTAVRQNTFQLLNLFSDKLDAAFVAHRMGLLTPAEAEEHFLHVIVSDLQEILESSNVTDKLDAETLLSWADDLNERKKLQDKIFDVEFPEAKETLRYLLTSGLSALDRYKKEDGKLNQKAVAWAKKNNGSKRKDRKKRLTALTGQFNANPEESNQLWAQRTSIRQHYGEPAPFLCPGTILQTMRAGTYEYLICVQQDCDCRRIRLEGQDFIFLPAKPVSGDQANCGDMYFKQDHEWQEWKSTIKVTNYKKSFLGPCKQTM